MSDYMSNKLDSHLTSLKELHDTIATFKVAFNRAMDEREMQRDEIARLQGEVQRLKLGITTDGMKVYIAMGADIRGGGDYVIIASPDIERIGYRVTNTGRLVNIQPYEG